MAPAGSSAMPDGDGRSIAIFVEDFSATGVVRNAIFIANRLAEDNHRVRLIVYRAQGELAARVSPLIAVTELAPRAAGGRSRSAALLRVIPLLRMCLRQQSPRVLLSAGNHGHFLCWAASRGMRGLKRIYRISNDLDHDPRSRSPRARFARISRRTKTWLYARDAECIIVVSRHLLESASLAPARKRKRVRVIPNGVSVEGVRQRALAPCPHPWLEDGRGPVLVAIGRLAPQKNFRMLVRALALVDHVRLIILGGGKPVAKGELLELAESIGVRGRIDLPGVVDNPFAYLGRASAFVLPSLWEGASNVLLEAIACGTPVVASELAGNAREILDEGTYGILVDPTDPEALAAGIRQQIGNAPVLPGERAQAFELDASLDAYADLIGKAASTP